MNKMSVSQIFFAASIGYLAYSLIQISIQIPNALRLIGESTERMEKFQPQINKIILQVGNINKQIPAILSQIEQTRPLIEQTLIESDKYSSQIPLLSAHLTRLEQQAAAVEKQLPDILKRIDNLVITTDNVTQEIAKWRPHSLEYIKQLEYSREDIPRYLTRIEDIATDAQMTISDAKTIGSENSKGIVKGLVKGVVSLPFDVVSNLAGIVDSSSKSAQQLTKEDITLLQQSAINVLTSEAITEKSWRNKSTGHYGKVNQGEKFQRQGKDCYQLTFTNYFNNEKERLLEDACLNDQNLWQIND
jgi:archaellum component FlaC